MNIQHEVAHNFSEVKGASFREWDGPPDKMLQGSWYSDAMTMSMKYYNVNFDEGKC